MFPEWTWLAGLLIGAAIGSFLNVVIYRTPRNLSLSNPKFSFCPACKHRLTGPDLFPLFSWLFLRGKCRHCKAKVPARYFFVEVVTGLVFAGIWRQYLILDSDPGRAIAYACGAATLVAIIYIDWEFFIIPDAINAFLAIVGIAYNAYLYIAGRPEATTWGMPSALAGWIVGVGVLWGIAFLGRVVFRKDAMGHGDIKMARGIGAVLFPAVAVMSFGLAVVLGAVLGIAQILLRRAPVAEEAAEEDEEYVPESIGSLLKSGFGYMLGFDIIGLCLPKFYESWFGESPTIDFEELESWEADRTMIPFGPYLALGAIIAAVYAGPLLNGVNAYIEWATGGSRSMEQTREGLSLQIRDSWSRHA